MNVIMEVAKELFKAKLETTKKADVGCKERGNEISYFTILYLA